MLQIAGKVINVFTIDGGTNKDGDEYDERHKVQLMGEVALQNGDVQMDLMDLTVQDLSDWTNLQGKDIAIDVGAFSPAKGNIIYFVRKGSKPKLIGGMA
ncbi:hypothetical protein [Pseudoalteromonas sp.]|uniref:hypothetical protein n=1 Tax=Pseudoalteromonas sp. TaxID=53249 RepID=UPI00257ACE9A|nr:hypothetical protein [Pseudoalteromonas sp.]